MSLNSSKIFEGFKSLGLVTGDVPNIIRIIEKLSEVRVVTAVKRNFHVYNDHLKFIETCNAHDSDINVIASDSIYIYTAANDEIFAWKYGHKWKSKSFKGCHNTVRQLLPFGPHLLAIDGDNSLIVWEIRNAEMVFQIPFGCDTFNMTVLMHPATYLNKVIIGSSQGSLQLWNIRTQNCIYEFKGWGHEVTRICQAPAVDIVAIGLLNGLIVIHNLKYDETIMKFKQEWGHVTALSFRTDGHPHLVSASPSGHLAIWNLEDEKLEAQMRNVHNGPVFGCNFINNESLLVTNSNDNSLKVWCFDESDSTGRLLYHRDGHRLSPTRIRFHGSRGQYILSAGFDCSLRAFCIFSEKSNRNLGSANDEIHSKKKKHINKKLAPIIAITSETTREKEWDGIAACHRHTNVVTTWSFDKFRIGDHKLIHQRFRGQNQVKALCICLTSCGNFAIIGYNTGHIDRFNIQSGIHRVTYGKPKAHNRAIRGVECDSLNQTVISGGIDSCLKFWRFKTGVEMNTMKFDSGIRQLVMHRENTLLAVSLTNRYVHIVDCETYRVIRNFGPHGKRVTDMAFNSECRWLITSCMDSMIRIWDLPLGQLIDAFRVYSPCTSLSLSPTGEFLATVHKDDVGIYLWSNVTLYNPVTLLPLPNDFQAKLLEFPTVKCDDEENDNEDAVGFETLQPESNDMEVSEDITYKSPEQISEELITLSLLPQSRWKNLLNLDLIRKRNKPKEPVRKPESAPFFLPTVPGLNPIFAVEEKTNDEKSPSKSQIINKLNPISEFGYLLLRCGENSDFTPFIDRLKSMGPSAIDAEIRSLSSEIIGSSQLMLLFLQSMEHTLYSNRDFELIQSYIGLFLKTHSEIISRDESLKTKCDELLRLIELSWNRLDEQFNKTLCIINYLRSAVL